MVERVTSSFTATVTVHQLVMLTAVQECYSNTEIFTASSASVLFICSYNVIYFAAGKSPVQQIWPTDGALYIFYR